MPNIESIYQAKNPLSVQEQFEYVKNVLLLYCFKKEEPSMHFSRS